MTPAVVNGAFRAQRVTGQQRYATEIADRLLDLPGVTEARPPDAWTGSAAREWGWTLTRLPRAAHGATLVSLTSRAPLVASQAIAVHDLFVLTHPQWYSRRYVATHAPVLRSHLRRADTVIAVSEPGAEQIRDYSGRDAVVAPNAPSAVFATPGDARHTLDLLGLTPGAYFLTVGSLDPRKNLTRLAHAYGALPAGVRARYPLVVVGGAASIYRAERAPWPPGMTAVGYVADDDLAALYRHARAVVFPSLAEGFGLPLVEASAAGARHLVISDLPVFRWICADGATYVDPRMAESIAAGLTFAAHEDGPPPTIAPGRFTWERSAAAIADAIGVSRVNA